MFYVLCIVCFGSLILDGIVYFIDIMNHLLFKFSTIEPISGFDLMVSMVRVYVKNFENQTNKKRHYRGQYFN